MKTIKVFEMFAGYGGASFGLNKVNFPHKIVGFSEIDKFAIHCYNQNHFNWDNETQKIIPIKNYGDATKIKVEDLPDFDLLTGGFPCQSFSVAILKLHELVKDYDK